MLMESPVKGRVVRNFVSLAQQSHQLLDGVVLVVIAHQRI